MKIPFKQPEKVDENYPSVLEYIGVKNCYLKRLNSTKDARRNDFAPHHHNGVEIHVVLEGCQVYEVDGEGYEVNAGSFIILPPFLKHRQTFSAPNTEKFAITFSKSGHTDRLPKDFCEKLFVVQSDDAIRSCLEFFENESRERKLLSPILIENRIVELLMHIARAIGAKEPSCSNNNHGENALLIMAKQYIEDNLPENISCLELAEYCHISQKQLSRIFKQYEDVSPMEYINRKRGLYAVGLLADKSLSLKDISEMMGFSSEYYFNAFFKKWSGMPPGAYRKTV